MVQKTHIHTQPVCRMNLCIMKRTIPSRNTVAFTRRGRDKKTRARHRRPMRLAGRERCDRVRTWVYKNKFRFLGVVSKRGHGRKLQAR